MNQPNMNHPFTLPPYGTMNAHYEEYIRNISLFPSDWKGILGSTLSLEHQWLEFRTDTLDLLAETLWPVFEHGSWKGQSTEFMVDLTRTDLELMLSLKNRAIAPLDQPFSSPLASAARQTHRELFEMEDDNSAVFGTYHNKYDPTLPYRLLETIPVLFKRGLDEKCGTSRLQFKAALLRPRPFQTALLLGYDKFTYLQAKSADTPSMCSAHCLQGILAVATSIERFLLDGESLSAGSWTALKQYAVDIGDRRVLAGVHYPSDNICSWIIAMRLANHVFRSPEVKVQLWDAITKQSLVFQAIQSCVSEGRGKAYLPSLQALEKAASTG